MIYGIGVDVVSVERVNAVVNKFGDKFARRILGIAEFARYITLASGYQKATYLAKRFAAKEAITKALGTGITLDFNFKDFEITNNNIGKPEVFLSNTVKKKISNSHLHNYKIDISLSDEKIFAIAFAIVSVNN